MKLFILAIVAFSAFMASAMTSEEYEAIRYEFFSQIKKNFNNNDCAKVLRLTFHDCVGGCDVGWVLGHKFFFKPRGYNSF